MPRYIDADAWNAFYIERTKDLESYNHYDMGYGDAMDQVDDWLDAQPTIEARPVVRGEWIEKPHTDGFGGHYFLYHCSRCDTPNAQKRNFCNECGAEMRGEDDG